MHGYIIMSIIFAKPFNTSHVYPPMCHVIHTQYTFVQLVTTFSLHPAYTTYTACTQGPTIHRQYTCVQTITTSRLHRLHCLRCLHTGRYNTHPVHILGYWQYVVLLDTYVVLLDVRYIQCMWTEVNGVLLYTSFKSVKVPLCYSDTLTLLLHPSLNSKIFSYTFSCIFIYKLVPIVV